MRKFLTFIILCAIPFIISGCTNINANTNEEVVQE